MKKIKLIQRAPFRYKGNFTFYDEGEVFEVIEEKEMELIGLAYKVKAYGCIFDGYANSDMFETLE